MYPFHHNIFCKSVGSDNHAISGYQSLIQCVCNMGLIIGVEGDKSNYRGLTQDSVPEV